VFADLLAHPGVEEQIRLRSRCGFLALHGGLEPATAEMAHAAAEASGASLYAVVQPDNLRWHLPAHRISAPDAPTLAAFLDHVDVVVSLHGYLRHDLTTAVLVGGANRALAAQLGARLRRALPDFEVIDDLAHIPAGLRGVHPQNPVNLTRAGGVQLELPHRVRSVGRGPHPSGRSPAAALVDALAAFATTTAP
jgi:phage replication-related protein YjqB (UPF0714/DUF867 family)